MIAGDEPSVPADNGATLRLLTLSTLYPNDAQPNHGVFVENRLRHLVGSGAATSIVVAPVAYVPPVARAMTPAWQALAGVARSEVRHGLEISHPRYLAIPRIGMSVAPSLLAASALREVRRLQALGSRVDIIDAHYMYPDGVAAVRVGRTLGLPVVVTARGSDITLLPDYLLPRLQIRRALESADALIAVSAALREHMVQLGADPARVHVLRNGVDTTLFRPIDRAATRALLGVGAENLLISVGHLIERKGHDRVIAALPQLPDCTLLIVGDGPERVVLAALAQRLGVAHRVRLLGSRPHAAMAALYSAADLLVLASSREGWANVLLEAMACGTPVVASPIDGNTEVVRAPAAGVIAPANTPDGFAVAVAGMLARPPNREATRRYAEGFGWAETTAGQLRVFRDVLARRGLDARNQSHPVARASEAVAA